MLCVLIMYIKKEPTNILAGAIATGTVLGATYFQLNDQSIVSGPIALDGTFATTVACNSRNLIFGAATAAASTIGVVAGDYVRDWKNASHREASTENVLVLPETKSLTARIPAYKFETV
jgi:hypothetical protein